MEYIVGPVLALLLSMKFTQWRTQPPKTSHEEILARIEQVEKEMPQKVIATVTPLAKAVQQLNQQVGL